MIVTRSWLQEYIDLSDISNEELYKTFNSIGLEVDSIKEHKIPAKVVVGEVLECSKHPDANKLNVCQVNIGNEVVQIVCGAANVVNAKYVAVATIGAVLPGDFKIKKAKLRGVESMGMICSSTELGLPKLEDGIMILDDSIGELVVGKELNEYNLVADTVIELEITANRGDALSIRGVARDLSAAFKKELKNLEYEPKRISIIGIAKQFKVVNKDEIPAKLEYLTISLDSVKTNMLQRLRLAFVSIESSDSVDAILRYAMHESGVVLRAYDCDKLHRDEDGRASIEVVKNRDLIEVKSGDKLLSIVGINQNDEFRANEKSAKIILEASYIEPDFAVEGFSSNKLKSDDIYYNTSRGSEPDIEFGVKVAQKSFDCSSDVEFSSSTIKVGKEFEPRKIALDINELTAIIGYEIPKSDIVDILKLLSFKLQKVDENSYRAEVPLHFHDIKNIYDIAEEVLRIYGINNIASKPLLVSEKSRITDTYLKYKAKRDLRQRAVGAGFFEAITYAFTSKEAVKKYVLETLDDSIELANPIVNELNTMRPSLLINLLDAASRNVKYGKKSISLFEIGVVFNSKREESENIAFIFSGLKERASVVNSAKGKRVDFASFVDMVGGVIGEFELEKVEPNALMHPYMSAKVLKDGVEVGFIAKLHPQVAKDYDLDDTFIAEFSLDKILPKHINAKALSNFQAVNKDLSILIDKDLNFYKVAKVLKEFKAKEPLLKDFYPLDIYSDDSLGDKKSLTIRFTIQSDSATLSDKEIEDVMSLILKTLEQECEAKLR
jgi:phenylalanyl-tRNA synthetase beta chain